MENKPIKGFDLNVPTKLQAFKKISEKVAAQLSCDPHEVYESMCNREKLADTALIEGIAVPHIILDSFFSPQLLIFELKNNLSDWQCLDESHVKSLICLLCPKNVDADDPNFSKIKQFFIKLADEQIDQEIAKAKTAQEIINILSR